MEIRNTQTGQEVNYFGEWLTVRSGAWNDIMNTCMYTIVAIHEGFNICHDKDGIFFALKR